MQIKFKKIVAVGLSIFMLNSFCALSANALQIDNGTGFYYEYIDDNTASIVKYFDSNTNVIVPSEIYNRDIVTITTTTFKSNKTIKSVVIPNTVKNLETFAFYGCSALETVKLSSSMTEIGALTFKNCTSLKSVYIPESITYIAENAFINDSGYTFICDKNSYAYQFASANGINCEFIGDTDNDGVISISDATLIQLHLSKLAELDNSSLLKADTDKDGKVNIMDVTRIQQILVDSTD